jgi:hypothetical protein
VEELEKAAVRPTSEGYFGSDIAEDAHLFDDHNVDLE